MTHANCILFHGWGYNASFWDKITVPSWVGNNHICYDRGYFGEYHKPPLGQGKNICVTHSTGLFFAAQDYDLSLFDEIIIYAGFESFENKAAARAMRLGLQKNPTKILNDFYNACGFIPNTLKNPNIQRLSDDLKMLETQNISDTLKQIPYTAYHGEYDTIIPQPLTGAKIIRGVGHLCNLM